MRIGHGYDVHRLTEGRALILGGVTIPYDKGLLGYSDADVLAHAVTDALLGAAAMGDIGALFPDTDPRYEGADSLALLAQAVRILGRCEPIWRPPAASVRTPSVSRPPQRRGWASPAPARAWRLTQSACFFEGGKIMLKPRRVEESRTEQIQILMPEHINGAGRLFGGKLVEWIDVVAGVVARRHSGRNVITAAIDNLQFKEGAYVNDTLVLIGRITYVGRTSMEVRVDTYVEDLTGTRKAVNRAYLVLVALDEKEQPAEVPGLLIDGEMEKAEWESGERRRALRTRRRLEGF